MRKATLEALKGSIKKWEDIVAGHGLNLGVGNCPLCWAFWEPGDCDGCPVQRKTGKCHCQGTPYNSAMKYQTPLIPHHIDDRLDEARAACQAELDFLRSLLPVEKGGRRGRAPKAAGK